jgi:hypothetical protein
MFLLAREPEGRLGAVQLWGLGLGVPAVTAGLAAEQRLVVLAGTFAVAAAIAGHLRWVLDMVRHRKRPALDWGLRLVLAGTVFLAAATATGLALATGAVTGPRFALAYAVLALGGWASLTITGMSLKIVPFLVWYRTYGPHVGRARVPTLADLGWPRAEAAAFVLLTAGMATTAVAVALGEPLWIRVSGAILAAGAAAFGAALGSVLRHAGRGAVANLTAASPVRAS